jgi:hypothetical protein
MGPHQLTGCACTRAVYWHEAMPHAAAHTPTSLQAVEIDRRRGAFGN